MTERRVLIGKNRVSEFDTLAFVQTSDCHIKLQTWLCTKKYGSDIVNGISLILLDNPCQKQSCRAR